MSSVVTVGMVVSYAVTARWILGIGSVWFSKSALAIQRKGLWDHLLHDLHDEGKDSQPNAEERH